MTFAAVGGAVLRSGYALPAHRPAHGTITIGRGPTYPKRNSVSTKPTTSDLLPPGLFERMLDGTVNLAAVRLVRWS